MFCFLFSAVFAQTDTLTMYKKTTAMIPMRDGIKLFTVILTPAYSTPALPFLITRTPYGADFDVKEGVPFSLARNSYLATLAKGGYLFVFQDIRGKYKSEGTMEIHQPVIHLTQKNAVDESTDTYDTIEWLLKNQSNHNGKAGIFGISYPGWLALAGAVDPHPALKASSEQACMGDLFLGDDFHHNGAFRLSYGFEYTYGVEGSKEGIDFPFPQYDLFDWYLKLGTLKNVNERYFHNKIPTWNHFVQNPDYNAFWKQNSTLGYVSRAEVPMLHVGGYYDQEDINGPQLMYRIMEKQDKANLNFLVLGPWNHGQWSRAKADSLGKIAFESNTAAWFQDLQKKWFDYWLKAKGEGKFSEAWCFQTGSNQWKAYTAWPPKEAVTTNLYAGSNQKAMFTPPVSKGGDDFVSYTSDPAKPVPYRTQPIEATYGRGSRWGSWQVEDQRFVSTRPDVVSFSTDTLMQAMTLTGKVTARLFASTSGTDADFVVKLIDVYPAFDPKNRAMSGYQLPVAMEVFRGRFRKSFEKPEPFVPGKPEEIVIDLHDINHTFGKGHQLMIQVQSSWFPVIDLNPQKYVPNIFEANASDFIKAEHHIYFTPQFPTHLELPVMK